MATTTVGQCVDLAERKILEEANDEYSEQNMLDLNDSLLEHAPCAHPYF